MEVTIINAFTGDPVTGNSVTESPQEKMTGSPVTVNPMIGNPAGVALVDVFPTDEVMLGVASEMALSETAFVCPGEGGSYNLRWFTPTSEVDLCGHATLAAAHYMWEEGLVSEAEEIGFYTKSGILKAKKKDGYIWLDFPRETINSCNMVVDRKTLKTALGAGGSIVFSGMTSMDFFIEVEDEDAVRNLKPDMSKLKDIDTRGFIVTAKSDNKKYDFVSRFFAPAYGIDEDPVTGSAHTALCPYWSSKLNKVDMTGCQLSNRGGVVKVKLVGDRVLLGGVAEVVRVVEVDI